ncbi:MAG: hypothetical protein H7Y04_14715 [Verrucomicrobia bacterium]|nr:hypothetical protein [Cytophagales bacterium]
MIKAVRLHYNNSFSEEKYLHFLQDLDQTAGHQIQFRVAETPVFIPDDLKHKILQACETIIEVICKPDFKDITAKAVPAHQFVPNEDAHTQLLAIDFAVCKDEAGNLVPQLIELQGFPSLYCFQHFLATMYRKHFAIPENFTHLFNQLDENGYFDLLSKVILDGHEPENVILLEIEPHKQKTNIDFYLTQQYLGIAPVCISEITKEGKNLFYLKNGIKTPIHRIYNRIIFDELEKRTDLKLGFNLTDEINATWAGHPNWFFRISKFTLPFIKSEFVPETHFLHQLPELPIDLENYVLKPLYSFAGAGVKINIQRSDIEQLTDKENYILQRKVAYEPVIQATDGGLVKTELRMLFAWHQDDEKPTLLTNLARLSRGIMIGVDFNKDKTWVGGSVGFFEK